MALNKIPQEVLEEIQSRLDIVSVLSEYINLKKSGRDFKGLCPFHQEKTPSFMVSPEKGIFHCFGCGEGGNVFKFLMKHDNLTFPEVVSKLALKAGVRLDLVVDSKEAHLHLEKEIYYKINRYAAWFYVDALKKKASNPAEIYLKARGINEASIDVFHLGYAPNEWDSLVKFLNAKKIPLEKAEKLGLVRRGKSEQYYDFFRNRLMFPIMDAQDRVLGFSARKLDEKDTGGKYINSPDTPVYHKSEAVYGLSQARDFLRKERKVILVEGNLDLIHLYQEGPKNVVAPLGTSLTNEQIRLLKRYVEDFILLFDGDEAGYKASLRSLELFLKEGIHPHFVALPADEDPDSVLNKWGVSEINDRITHSKPFIEWLIENELSKSGIRTDERIKAAQKIQLFIELMPNVLEKKAYQTRISQFMGVEESMARPLDQKYVRQNQPNVRGSEKKIEKQKNSLERILLQFYLRFPNIVSSVLTSEIIENFEDIELKDLGLKIVSEYETFGEILPIRLIEKATDLSNLVTQLLMDPILSEENQVPILVGDALENWQKKKLKRELKELTGKIHVAEVNQNIDTLELLLKQRTSLMNRVKKDK